MTKRLAILIALLACALLLLAVSGCTVAKLATQMDDNWCAEHPTAPGWRCMDHVRPGYQGSALR